MPIIQIILVGLGLSMDAFAVSFCNGIAQKGSRLKEASITSVTFGLFQGIMPLLGWLLGVGFSKKIEIIDHWLVFVLLSYVGIHMIVTAIREKKLPSEEQTSSDFNYKTLLLTAIATSLDAFAVGVSFAFSGINTLPEILSTCAIIAIITAAFCLAGFYAGRKLGSIFKKTAEILGGVLLIGIGVKILVEHLLAST